jgi:ABC-type sugar transport system substrate-binding protein
MNGFVTHAEAKGWEVIVTNASNDAEKQANQLDNFIAQGVDAIVTVPVDSKAVCSSVERAADAGILFYTIDRSTIGCKVNMTVQADNHLAGQQAGEELVKLLTTKYGEPKGTVLELQGDLGQNVAQLRGGGFNDVMKKYKNIKVISKPTQWKSEIFAQATLDVVGSTDIDGIYYHSDCVGTTTVSAALDQLKKNYKRGHPNHIFRVGVDGCSDGLQAIKDGWTDQASSQPLPDFGIIANWIEKELNNETITIGPVIQKGAPWSPAKIFKSDTGLMLNLATTNATAANVYNPALWGNIK